MKHTGRRKDRINSSPKAVTAMVAEFLDNAQLLMHEQAKAHTISEKEWTFTQLRMAES